MSLHERIAQRLGWTVEQAQSLSLQSLRDIVRPVSPKLAHEIDAVIRCDASVLAGPRYTLEDIEQDWASDDATGTP